MEQKNKDLIESIVQNAKLRVVGRNLWKDVVGLGKITMKQYRDMVLAQGRDLIIIERLERSI